MRLAPVQLIYVERVRFDMQKLQNPEISGIEYQHGTLFEYEMREYIFEKWGRKCVYCDVENVPLNMDHVKCQAKGGSNRASNLVPACIPCNKAKDTLDVRDFVKDPKRLARILAQLKAPLQDAVAVNATRWELDRKLRELGLPVEASTGGKTKWNRKQFDVPKTHALDALCVGDVADIARWQEKILRIQCTGRGKYARTTSDKYGFPRSQLPRIKIFYKFRTGDLVQASILNGKNIGVWSGRVTVRSTGYFAIQTGNNKIDGVSYKNLKLLQRGDGYGYSRKPTIEKGELSSSNP
jgi:hypothetical protein